EAVLFSGRPATMGQEQRPVQRLWRAGRVTVWTPAVRLAPHGPKRPTVPPARSGVSAHSLPSPPTGCAGWAAAGRAARHRVSRPGSPSARARPPVRRVQMAVAAVHGSNALALPPLRPGTADGL